MVFFLQIERKFRALYNKVRKLKEEEIDFSMNIKKEEFQTKETNIFSCLFSKSLLPLYLILIILNIIILNLLK